MSARTPGEFPRTEEVKSLIKEAGNVKLVVDGITMEIPPELDAALRRACESAESAKLPKEMTTTQAAEFLDMSRPSVVKLMRAGKLSYRKVGKHHRISMASLQAYRKQMFRQASQAAEEITRMGQEIELSNPEGAAAEAR
jgi:excisionase family DNA binding protein